MSSEKTTNVEKEEFLARLYEAFGTNETAKIAAKIGVIYQTIDNYVKGRIPRADVLKKISDSTNVSIHWLLTGEGPKSRDDLKRTAGEVVEQPQVDIEQIKWEAQRELAVEVSKLIRERRHMNKGKRKTA